MASRWRVMATVGALVLAMTSLVGCKPTFTGTITDLPLGDGGSFAPILSADGRTVVFTSTSSDLVAGDDNGEADVFILDRDTGELTRITDGNSSSNATSVSADGRWIGFSSFATDLVEEHVDGSIHTYLWNRDSQVIELIGRGSSPHVSDDGSVVAFTHGSGAAARAAVWVRGSGITNLIGEASQVGHITGNGRWVSYTAGGFRGRARIHDRLTGEVTWTPEVLGTTSSLKLSADGIHAVLTAEGDQWIPELGPTQALVYWHVPTGDLVPINLRQTGTAARQLALPQISRDGSAVVYGLRSWVEGEVPHSLHLWEVESRRNTRIVAADHVVTDHAISGDGRTVAFRHHRDVDPDYHAYVAIWDRVDHPE